MSPMSIRRSVVASVMLAGEASRLWKPGGLPSGNFTLKAWLNEKMTLALPVTLNAGRHFMWNSPRAKLAASR